MKPDDITGRAEVWEGIEKLKEMKRMSPTVLSLGEQG